MLRTAQSLPQKWAFDTGLRPRPFPDEAASLLPGPLAATRTGLTPASDDELTTQDQPPTRSTSCLLGARKVFIDRSSSVARAPTCSTILFSSRCGTSAWHADHDTVSARSASCRAERLVGSSRQASTGSDAWTS